jgi:hypothetical protein
MAEIGHNHVTLVVDLEFGQRAKAQSMLGPLWVIQSPQNTPIIRELWATENSRFPDSPTLFDAVAGRSPEESAVEFIETVDEHHPGWQTFEIIGVRPSAKLLDALHRCAMGSIRETRTGFIFSQE